MRAEEPPPLTAAEAARLLGCAPQHILAWAVFGIPVGNRTVVLRHIHVRGRLRFTLGAVKTFRSACGRALNHVLHPPIARTSPASEPQPMRKPKRRRG